MKRRMNKRMAAATLAGAMVLSMNGMAWAAVTEFNLTKEVTTDGKTHAPNTAFSFTITEGDEGTLGTAKVYAGVPGGLTLDTANNAFSFAPEADTSATYTKTGKINVNVGVFEKPGVYHYLVTETQGTYDGITYDVTPRHLYVFVVNATNGYEVDAIKVVKDGETAKADDLKIVNSYGDGTTNDDIHDFIIKKTVTGNQGHKNMPFSFTVTINGDNAGKVGAEKYMAVKTPKTGGEETIHITDGVAENFTLMDGETLHIYGLSEKDTYTVVETDANTDGYTTTVPGNAAGTLTADGITVEFINDKQVGPATGVAMTFAPYVLLVAAAGGLGAVVLGKKKREDDEI
uniref:DUF7601 domain-containing protein n=1 Tax=Candidatus Ventrimonas sp. TaxID=3048889 RepID=UPI003FEFD44E